MKENCLVSVEFTQYMYLYGHFLTAIYARKKYLCLYKKIRLLKEEILMIYHNSYKYILASYLINSMFNIKPLNILCLFLGICMFNYVRNVKLFKLYIYIQNVTEYKYPCIVPFIHKEHLLVVLKEDLELACKHCSTCVYILRYQTGKNNCNPCHNSRLIFIITYEI